jgi:hypothetical protein
VVGRYVPEPRGGFFTDDDPLSDPAAYAHLKTLPVTSLSGSGQRIVLTPIDECSAIAFKFIGKPASNSSVPRMGIGAFWGVSKVVAGTDTEYLAEYLGQFDLTMGEAGLDGSGSDIFEAGTKWVRRFTVRTDRTLFPGERKVGEEGEASPVVVLDEMGYHAIIIELRNLKPDGAAFDVQPTTDLGVLYRILG